MLEVYIERWTEPGGITRFPWSVWVDGRQVQHSGRNDDPDAAEAEARDFCRKAIGREPDRVRRL